MYHDFLHACAPQPTPLGSVPSVCKSFLTKSAAGNGINDQISGTETENNGLKNTKVLKKNWMICGFVTSNDTFDITESFDPLYEF